MKPIHRSLFLFGLIVLVNTADAHGHHGLGHGHHHHLGSAPPPQSFLIPGHNDHHHGIAAPPEALPIHRHGHHGPDHGHHHHGIAPSPQPLPTVENTYEKKCNQTPFPETCFAVTQRYSNAYFPHTDDITFLNMMIKAAVDGAWFAAIESAKISGDPKTPESVAKNLRECPTAFTEASKNIRKAQAAITNGDHLPALVYLRVVIDNAGRCNEIFKERPTAEKNPMAEDTQNLVEIASISLSFASLAFGIPPP